MTKPKLFVLFGFKRSGKDTVAQILQTHFRCHSLAYADPIYKEVWEKLGISCEHLFDPKPIQKLLEENKEIPLWHILPGDTWPKNFINKSFGSLRWFLNEVGESNKRIFGQDYYARLMREQVELAGVGHSAVIIRDCRHIQEIEDLGYYTPNFEVIPIWVKRTDMTPSWYSDDLEIPSPSDLAVWAEEHGTTFHEVMWLPYIRKEAKAVFLNDSTIENLTTEVKKWADSL